MSYKPSDIDVILAWKHYRPEVSENTRTDGLNLFSGSLVIGITEETGLKTVINYTQGGGNFISVLTSRHVNMAKGFAHRTIPPYYVDINERIGVIRKRIIGEHGDWVDVHKRAKEYGKKMSRRL